MRNSPERIGSISLFLGTAFLLASNVMGHGICIHPDPRGALLMSAAGLLLFAIAYFHAQRWRERFIRVLQLVLALSTFSLVAALVIADLQEFHRMAIQDWGAIPSPQLIFSVTYALASLLALLGITIGVRRRPALSTAE